MSERDELIEYLRMCSACHGCGIGADGDTCTNCDDQRQPNRRAASMLERDGDELARLADNALRFSLDEAGIASRERDAVELVELRKRAADLAAENDWLRAYTSQSAKACVYCGLGANEQGQCKSGFPGCARADDQMMCREVGVALERDALRAENEALRKDAEQTP